MDIIASGYVFTWKFTKQRYESDGRTAPGSRLLIVPKKIFYVEYTYDESMKVKWPNQKLRVYLFQPGGNSRQCRKRFKKRKLKKKYAELVTPQRMWPNPGAWNPNRRHRQRAITVEQQSICTHFNQHPWYMAQVQITEFNNSRPYRFMTCTTRYIS